MSDLMKYNRIMPRDDDSFYLWYDSLKGFRLNITGEGNHNFNQEAEVLFQIERERIIKLLESIYDYPNGWDYDNPIESMIDLIRKESP